MNNGNCSTNCVGFGNNSILWILIILLFMPGIFGGGCGCGSNNDLFIIIILLLLFTGGSNIFNSN